MGLLTTICAPLATVSASLYRGMTGVTGDFSSKELSADKLYGRLRHLHRQNLAFGYYPGSLRSAVITVGLVHIFLAAGVDLTFGLEEYVHSLLVTYSGYNVANPISYLVTSLVIWFVICTARKLILRQLFGYQGWIHERGKPSLKTKFVMGSIKLLTGFANPITKQLYGLQGMLPHLPVPPLKDTVNRYLESMRPLMEDSEFNQLKERAEEFTNGPGKKFQWYLVLKSWFSQNYVSDWWEQFVYLMGRSTLLTNSNYYSVDLINVPETHQATRAALLIYETLAYRQSIEDNTMEPVIGQGVIPLCSWQYERFFNTCRIPGETTDTLQHVLQDTANYIVVHCKGKYYKVPILHPSQGKYRKGRPLTVSEWQAQFLRILEQASDPLVENMGEDKLASFTAWDRVNWANARRKYFSSGVNKESLDIIEKAAFIVVLDDDEYSTYVGEPDSQNFDKLSRSLLHGNGSNRWLDKSFNFIFGTKGRVGLNVEHTWADAAPLSHMWEVIFSKSLQFTKFDENRMIDVPVEMDPPPFNRLQWNFSVECQESMKTAMKFAQQIIADTDLKTLTFRHFGKNRMKTCKTSPDAFIQMGLQLAYYRNTGKFDLTYEPSMTRLFKQGRTETVRACTVESCNWVRSMDSDLPREEKIRLFQKACERHQLNYQASLCGKGFDRHLFALFVVSKYLKVDSQFLTDALSEPWRLSTSPIPSCQTTLKGARELISVGGGFGAVVPDGYGVSYLATNAGEDLIIFHVTSKKSCSSTDSRKFASEIEKALLDASALFTVDNNNSNGVDGQPSKSSKDTKKRS